MGGSLPAQRGEIVPMSARRTRIKSEAAALWRALYDEAPPGEADGAEMLELMLNRLPAPSYDRLHSPHLNAASMSWPKRSR